MTELLNLWTSPFIGAIEAIVAIVTIVPIVTIETKKPLSQFFGF